MKIWDFESHEKRFWDFEICPKLSETHGFGGTILYPSLSCLILKIFMSPSTKKGTKQSSARVMIAECNTTYPQLKVKIHLHQIMHALSSSNLARSHQMHPRISPLAWERIQENYTLKIKITLTSISNKLAVMIAVLQKKEKASANIILALS